MLAAEINTTRYNTHDTWGNSGPQRKKSPQKKQVNFGSSSKSGLLKQSADFFIDGLDKIIGREKGIGQFGSNVINYAGKALLPPLMILAGSHFTDEKDESIKSQMLVPPLDAAITFGLAGVFGFVANKIVGKAAELGKFGDFYKQADHLRELKSMSTLGMTLLAIPIAAKILSWSFPKVKSEIDGIEVPGKLYSDLYAAKFDKNSDYAIFAQSLRPEFGSLTGGDRKDG